MNVTELFKGVAVVIDDEIHESDNYLQKILNQIRDKNIPLIEYSSIPTHEIVDNFQNLSFVLLDWRLIKEEISADEISGGVTLPAGIETHEAQKNIAFINKLKEVCYCPIFIFTNEDQDRIIETLTDANLYNKNKPNHIFIQSKVHLKKKDIVFKEIEKWLKSNPAIYVLKEWEREYTNSKNKMFCQFHELSPNWPRIMWKNFEDDGGNKSLELGELISRNLHTRMTPFEFSEEILNKKESKTQKTELRKVLEGERFLKVNALHEDDVSTGDIFREEYQDAGQTKTRYYLNIRAQCDLMRNSSSLDLYCLKGRIVEEKDIGKKKGLPFNNGEFIEKINHAVVPFLDDGKIIQFLFRDLKIEKWSKLKEKRIGRLLPPYINRIQQRYSLYIQRQGLPRTPNAAIYPL
ncbi:MAG: hypothetical protein JXR90_07215 [Spirochaetes bacterium]|nr:hypothetical protein [Spirochaetota bacterium]